MNGNIHDIECQAVDQITGTFPTFRLDDDVSLFTHAFPDADENERRAHNLSTLLEYEESMQAWEEAKNSGELGSKLS